MDMIEHLGLPADTPLTATQIRYRFWKSVGLCIKCGEAVCHGSATYCALHREKKNAYRKIWWERRRAAGQCIRCDKPTEGKSFCPEHLEEYNERMKEYMRGYNKRKLTGVL